MTTEIIATENQSENKKQTHKPSFFVENAELQKALKPLTGIVDHAQVIQILSFLKCTLKDQRLCLTGSNSEIEMHISVPVIDIQGLEDHFSFTLPCKKLFEISRQVSPDQLLKFHIEQP